MLVEEQVCLLRVGAAAFPMIPVAPTALIMGCYVSVFLGLTAQATTYRRSAAAAPKRPVLDLPI